MNAFLPLISAIAILGGCTPSPAPVPVAPAQPVENTNVAATSKAAEPEIPSHELVKVGMLEAEARRLLGEPMSTTETLEGTSASYMYGMPNFTMPTVPNMPSGPSTGSMAAGFLSQVAGMAAGFAGPAGALAAGAGSTVLNMGVGLAESADEPEIPAEPDMSKLVVVTITFKDGIVTSVQRMKPGMMGAAAGGY